MTTLVLISLFLSASHLTRRVWRDGLRSAGLVAIVLCQASHADGAGQLTRFAQLASYRVSIQTGNAMTSGTGTAIHPQLILTNAHVVQSTRHRARVYRPKSGESYVGTVEAIQHSADLAVVYIPTANFRWVEIGDDPRPGQDVEVFGYGRDDTLDHGRGQVIGLRGYRAPGVPVAHANFGYRSGDSGSGLIADGRLVAVNWGTSAEGAPSGVSTPAANVRGFLERWRQSSPLAQRLSGGCFGGACPPRGDNNSGHGDGWQLAPDDPTGPSTQPEQPPQPQQPATDIQPLVDRIDALTEQIAKLQRTPGPAGPPGDRGPEGPQGKPGRDGQDASPAEAARLAVEQLRRLPIRVEVMSPDGRSVLDAQDVYLGGEPLRLYQWPEDALSNSRR